jgi:hypothetical protein
MLTKDQFRMDAEKERDNSKRMETVGKLSSPVAHDINNLLSGILGYCDLILSEPAAEHPKTPIEEISNAAKRMASMARMLLAFTPKGILHPEIVDANGIIHEIERFILHLAGPGIEFSVTEETALWQIRADSAQMKRALLTMAMDIGERMPKGGKFALETKNLSFGKNEMQNCPEKPGNYVLITAIVEGNMSAIPSIHGQITPENAEQFDKKAGWGISEAFEAIRTCEGEIFLDKTSAHEMRIQIYFPAIASESKT